MIENRYGRIAQLVEQLTLNQRVLGSSPSASTILFTLLSHLAGIACAARRLAKVFEQHN